MQKLFNLRAGSLGAMGWLFILLIFFVALAGHRLSYPFEPVWDEQYYVPAAQALVAGHDFIETPHPPLGKFLTALSIYALGDNPFAWRLPALIAGGGVLVCVYYLGVFCTGSGAGGLIAALILAAESLAFVQSRTAIYSSIMLFFFLLAILLLMRWYKRGHGSAVVFSALAFGAAVATRWVALSGAVLLVYVGWLAVCSRQMTRRQALLYATSFLAVAAALYMALFLIGPLARGEGVLEGLFANRIMFRNHWTNLSLQHRYSSPWWSWPLLIRPVWFGFRSYPMLAADGSQVVEGILNIGNPVFFAALPVAVGVACYRFCRRRGTSGAPLLLLLGIGSQWLQWAWVPQNTFLHYYYTVLPFGAVLIAEVLLSLWRYSLLGRVVCVLYLASACAMFAYWYPLLTAIPVSRAFVMNHIWLESWW